MSRVTATPTECRGDACPSVTLTYEEAKGRYLAKNNSADRWARVTASNFAAADTACLAPGAAEHLTLKSVVAPYRAEYAEPGCGEHDPGDNPPPGE